MYSSPYKSPYGSPYRSPFGSSGGLPAGAQYIAAGDSNVMGLAPWASPWSGFTNPAAVTNVGLGTSRMVDPSNTVGVGGGTVTPTIDLIAAPAASYPSVRVIVLGVGTNDVREYVKAGLTQAQCLAKMQDDLIDLTQACYDLNLFPLVFNQHNLGEMYKSSNWWGNDIISLDAGKDAIAEGLVTAWNAWLASKASATTWRVIDAASVINGASNTMKAEYVYSGPHWNTLASSTVIKDAVNAAIQDVPVFTQTYLNMSQSGATAGDATYFITYNFDETKDTIWEFEFKGGAVLTGAQRLIGTTGFSPTGVQFNASPSTTIQYWLFGQVATIASQPRDTTYRTLTFSWPANTGAGNLNYNSVDTSMTRSTTYSPDAVYVGAGGAFAVTDSPWRGVIRKVKIYESGYLIHCYRLNDGGGALGTTATNLIGSNASINKGSGVWS